MYLFSSKVNKDFDKGSLVLKELKVFKAVLNRTDPQKSEALRKIEQLGFEHIISLQLETKEDKYKLIFELFSKGNILLTKDNKILTSQTFEVFIKNSCEISSKSIEIHRIRPIDLEDAKTTDTAIREFLNFIGSRPLIGYYLEFDVNMINKYIKPMLGVTLPNEKIEVSEIYFDKTIALIPQGNIDWRFDTIMKNCGVPDMGAHNAVNDAIMTAMIFLKLNAKGTKSLWLR